MFYGILILGCILIAALHLYPISIESLFKSTSRGLTQPEVIAQQLVNFDPHLELPEYKFYHLMIWDMKALEKKYGINPNSAFQELRKALNLDIKSDRKIKGIIQTSFLQYISMCAFTWFMLLHMTATLGFSLEIVDISLILLWQIIGSYLFSQVVKSIKMRICAPFLPLFKMIYKVRCLVKTSRPLHEIKTEMEEYLDQKKSSKKHFSIIQRLEFYLRTIKTKGTLPKEELNLLVEEIWDHYEVSLEKMEKLLLGVKLLSFLLFVIPGYFYSIGLVIGQVGI
ncbi:MAG: hypothetical protein CME65_01165 [Halobacteriovoraceae bacterium]|nr:hypothetical protein [Halobacteriovoraceae bacterium]